MTPDQLVSALLAPPEIQYVDIALRTGLRLEQITAKLETLPAPDGPEGLLRPRRSTRRPSCSTTIRGSRRSSRTRPRAPRSRVPVAGDLPGPARHDARGAGPADARQVHHERRAERMDVPAARGLTFYQVLTLASIVEREAVARRRASRSSPASTRTGSTPRKSPHELLDVGPDDLLRRTTRWSSRKIAVDQVDRRTRSGRRSRAA